MNDLIGIGVVGFRIDAGKHMWPGDLAKVYGRLAQVNGQAPFIVNEVIDQGGEPITADQYFHLGRVTEFKYCMNIGRTFRGHSPLKDLKTFGSGWGMMPDGNAFVFVDNHDNQRGHGGGGDILTFKDPHNYKQAVAFALAWPYGFTRIMSSYYFDHGDQGPPASGDSIADVPINEDETCGGEWVCEHRWQQIGHMAQWRNMAGGTDQNVDNWWDNGNNQIAFSRNGKAFITFNREGYDMDEKLQTGLSEGTYCDVISGGFNGDYCTGSEVYVSGSGIANIYLSSLSDQNAGMLAIHQGNSL